MIRFIPLKKSCLRWFLRCLQDLVNTHEKVLSLVVSNVLARERHTAAHPFARDSKEKIINLNAIGIGRFQIALVRRSPTEEKKTTPPKAFLVAAGEAIHGSTHAVSEPGNGAGWMGSVSERV